MADDTVAMSDSQERSEGQPSVMKAIDPTKDAAELSAALKLLSVGSQPSTPQQGDTCSTTSDSSLEQAQGVRHGLPRRIHSSVDVDAAKQAAMSALAGLDMTTTKANLDASKAAAATARANGEIPAHTKKSSLRSVSCRQLGSSTASTITTSASSNTPPGPKSVAFDDSATAKSRAAADLRPAQWRGGITDGQPRRTARGPASRCISLPHVLQGRAGMANRLAATYAQDAALQQQLHMMNGSTGLAQPYTLSQLQPGITHVDTLSMYQLQSQMAAGGPGATMLTQQHSFGAPGLVTLDDSALSMRSGTLMMQQQPQQLQQVQQQQARLGGAGWPQAAGPTQLTRWGSGQMSQQPVAGGLGQPNAQLLAQIHSGSQNPSAADALWMAPTASSGMQLSGARPQAVILAQPTVSGGMQGMSVLQPQQLLAPGLQASAQTGSLGGQAHTAINAAGAPSAASGSALLESYQSVSWDVLAAAQGEAALREQLLTELVLLLTMLHTLNTVVKGNMSTTDALNDFRYLATAARRHMATFTLLSQAGNIAVQLLALITPLACRSHNSSELLEAAFLVLDTLALANRDVAAVVSQQRVTALTSLCLQVPVDQLLQQQALGVHWITSLAGAVGRNKAVLESMASEGGQGQAAAGLQQPGMGASNIMMAASQPMLMTSGPGVGAPSVMTSAGGSALSPGRKTPLATYFEETAGGGGVAAQGGAAAGLAGPGGMAGLSLGPSATPGPGQLSDPLLGEALGMLPSAAIGDNLTNAAKLGSLPLGVGASQLPGGGRVGPGGQGVGAGGFPLGGNLSLFGDAGGLVGNPGSNVGSNPSAPGLVGV